MTPRLGHFPLALCPIRGANTGARIPVIEWLLLKEEELPPCARGELIELVGDVGVIA